MSGASSRNPFKNLLKAGSKKTKPKHQQDPDDKKDKDSWSARGADGWANVIDTLTRRNSRRASSRSVDSGLGDSFRRTNSRKSANSAAAKAEHRSDLFTAVKTARQEQKLSLVQENGETEGNYTDRDRPKAIKEDQIQDECADLEVGEDAGTPGQTQLADLEDVQQRLQSAGMDSDDENRQHSDGITSCHELLMGVIKEGNAIYNEYDGNFCNTHIEVDKEKWKEMTHIIIDVSSSIKEDIVSSPDNGFQKRESLQNKLKPYINKDEKEVATGSSSSSTSTTKANIDKQSVSNMIAVVEPSEPLPGPGSKPGNEPESSSSTITVQPISASRTIVSASYTNERGNISQTDISRPLLPSKRRRSESFTDSTSEATVIQGEANRQSAAVEDSDGRWCASLADMLRSIPDGYAKDKLKLEIHKQVFTVKYEGGNGIAFIIDV